MRVGDEVGFERSASGKLLDARMAFAGRVTAIGDITAKRVTAERANPPLRSNSNAFARTTQYELIFR